jgi:hypothetical protein
MTRMQLADANFALAATKADKGVPTSTHFYQSVTLQSLVAPVSEEEFRARYWEKKPLIVHRGNPDYYGDLFTLQDFDDSLRAGANYIKTAEITKKPERRQGTSVANLERILADMRDGHTLILDAVQEYNSKLGQFCRRLARETVSRYQTNIYLTPANGKGFTAHWDNHDVFVLQVIGSKHWKVEKERRLLPAKDGSAENEDRDFRGEVDAFTLQQGDAVYIPRGFVHAAECGSEYSQHITLGVYPNTWDDLLLAALRATILQDVSLRLALPFGHAQGGDAGIIGRLREALGRTADPAFLSGVLEQFRDEVVQKAPLDISGAIMSSFQSRPVALDDKIRSRADLVYKMRLQPEAVTLKVGTRAITFPDFFGAAVKFALETPEFTVRDLPGDLEDEEKIAFAERLIQEALIVRV